jgi:hypothetical protein
VAVTGRDGCAEVEFPFGIVFAAAGRSRVQDGWVGVDQVVEFEFSAEASQVRRARGGA